jgi:hypothetical protein
MKLVWCKDRADVILTVHKVHYKSIEKDVIKFKGTLSHRRIPNCDYETKNFKMSLTRFKQLQIVNG